MTVTIKAKALEAFVADIFESAGCSEDEGDRIGRYLVSANLSGHDSHGVVRVPRYATQKKNGTVVSDGTVCVLVDTPVIAAVLGSVLLARFGCVQRRFSTAPYWVGVPRPGHDPLVLDFATPIVAEGKVLVASQGGKKIPDGALIGPDGKPSSDPHLLYGDYTPTGPRDHSKGTGAIQAFGDHKGSGLAFMCEILGGALSATGTTDPQRGQFANGILSFYAHPTVFDPVGFFPQ